MTVCGTGTWSGPLPGDPDNNVVLSAAEGFGGIRVSWTLPSTYPYAVAFVNVYRNTTADYSSATLLASTSGSFYFDSNDTPDEVTYFYWIVLVSINGTYGAVIGPASAVSRPTVTHILEELTGKIDRSVLGLSLKGELDAIDTVDGRVSLEIADRIADTTALATVVTEIDGEMTTAVATVQAIDIQRIADNTAIAAHVDFVAAGLGDDIASVQTDMVAITGVQDGKITGIGARYTALLTVNNLVGGFGIYNDGTSVSAGFDVDTFWVGRTDANKVKPFIIDGDETFIDQAVVNKLTFTKLIAADGSLVVEDGKIKTDYIETKGMVIRAMDGTILFGAGTALDWANVGGTGKPADGATRNVAKGVWASGVAYVVGDNVLSGGYGWECILAHTSSGAITPPTYPVESNTYWILAAVGGADGADGLPGTNGVNGQGQVKAVAFIRGASASAPGGGSFASPTPTGSPTWSDGIPADDTQPLWMTTRIFTSDGLAPQQSVWSTPAKVGIPSIGTRNVFSVLGTTASIGATDATFHVTPVPADVYMGTQTSTDSGATWGAVVGKVKIKGENGLDGWAVYTATIYKQVGPDPGNPVATASTYNFATGVLTPPAGWSVIQPSTTTVNTWACEYTFMGAAGSTVTGTGNWSATRIDAVAGAAGSNGVSINTVELYWQNATAPALPTGTTFDFSTNTVTGSLGSWSRTMPASSTVPTYMTSCTFTVTAPTTTQVRSVWSTAVIVAQNGSAGAAGSPGTPGTRGSRTLYDVNSGGGSTGYNSLTTYVYGANAAGSASYSAKATDLIAAATVGSTPTTPVKGDTVVFSNGSSFVNTLTYTGSVWAGPGVVMDGSLLVTGSVTASKINTNGLDIRDGSGNLIFSAGQAPTNTAYGVNHCYNADFSQGLAGWTIVANSFSATVGINLDPTWAINGGTGDSNNTLYVAQPNGTTSGYFEEESDKISVTGSKTYCLSAYTGAHSCNVDVFFTSYTAAGVAIANHGYLADSNNVAASGGKLLTGYKRHKVIAAVASDASYIKIRLRKFGSISPAGSSYMFVARVQFEEVGAAAVAAGPWAAPNNAIGSNRPITASNITTYMANAAIGSVQIGDAAITSAKIGNLEVKSANIENLTVGTGKLSANASSKTYISDGSNLTITIPADCASVVVMAGFGKHSTSIFTDPGFSTFDSPGQGSINLVGGGSVLGIGAAVWAIESPGAGTFTFNATPVAGACGDIVLVVVVNKR